MGELQLVNAKQASDVESPFLLKGTTVLSLHLLDDETSSGTSPLPPLSNQEVLDSTVSPFSEYQQLYAKNLVFDTSGRTPQSPVGFTQGW